MNLEAVLKNSIYDIPAGLWLNKAVLRLDSCTHKLGFDFGEDIAKESAMSVKHRQKLTLVLAGYLEVASGSHDKRVASDVANAIIWGFKKHALEEDKWLRDERGTEPLYTFVVELIDYRTPGFATAFKNLVSHQDTVIAIDSIMSLQHYRGNMLNLLFNYDWEGMLNLNVGRFLGELAVK